MNSSALGSTKETSLTASSLSPFPSFSKTVNAVFSVETARGLSASMSSNLSAKFADGRAREFLWGITLSKDEPEYTWSFEEEDEDKDFLEHTLFLRHAVLGESAVQDERNVIAVQTKTFSGDEVKQPLFSLTLGKNDMCQLDINFGHEVPVIFKLTQGTGPVHLSAQQLVEFPPEGLEETEMTDYTATEEDISEEDEEGEDKEEEEGSPGKGAKGKKRKVSLDKGAAKKKKGKADESSEEDEDEEEEEEDESMEDEEEDDEDEEEEPTPEKKKSKAKTKAAKSKKAPAAKPAAKKAKKKSK